MKRLAKTTRSLLAACCMAAGTAHAVPVMWTDWTSIGSNAATGTIGGVSVTIASTVAMNGVSLTGSGTNYWTEPNPSDRPYTGGTVSNAPTAAEQVGLNSANTITVTFGSAINSLYMALLSVGQPGVPVTYDFNQAFTIDSEGEGFFGNDATDGVLGAGDTLTMREFHGMLHFSAPVTSLTFTTNPAENWHAFTFGAAAVPQPATLAMLGLGLLAFGFRRKRSL
ncbi:MAG: PEP-CTERM sorting domain-containing protein [Betaproteobacteria bacterium]